jgi:hypothetical protein
MASVYRYENTEGTAQHKRTASSVRVYGAHLSTSDRDRLRTLVDDFAERALVPYVERQMRVLNEQILSRRGLHKSLLNGAKKWLAHSFIDGQLCACRFAGGGTSSSAALTSAINSVTTTVSTTVAGGTSGVVHSAVQLSGMGGRSSSPQLLPQSPVPPRFVIVSSSSSSLSYVVCSMKRANRKHVD